MHRLVRQRRTHFPCTQRHTAAITTAAATAAAATAAAAMLRYGGENWGAGSDRKHAQKQMWPRAAMRTMR